MGNTSLSGSSHNVQTTFAYAAPEILLCEKWVLLLIWPSAITYLCYHLPGHEQAGWTNLHAGPSVVVMQPLLLLLFATITFA